jgi:hypothetical protein
MISLLVLNASAPVQHVPARRWIPPSKNQIKANVDGAVSRNNTVGAVVVIYWDSNGLYQSFK